MLIYCSPYLYNSVYIYIILYINKYIYMSNLDVRVSWVTAHTSAPFGVCCAVWWPCLIILGFVAHQRINQLREHGIFHQRYHSECHLWGDGHVHSLLWCENHGPWFWSITRCPWMILSYMIIWWWWSFTFPLVHPPSGAIWWEYVSFGTAPWRKSKLCPLAS